MPELGVDVRRHDHAYRVCVGNFAAARLFDVIAEQAPARSYIVAVDAVVDDLHGIADEVEDRPGWRVIRLPAGEEHKKVADFLSLCERALAYGVDRNTVLVAVGGGVVGDVTGFAAAVLLRGLRYVQVPTTLLAQVDSSVGGKTGINMAGGKNLLGAFHQPELVVASSSFLKTLSEREYLSGLAEAVKYGVIGDAGFYERMVRESRRTATRDPIHLGEVVAHCCAMKAGIVGGDERESDGRILLNLGHTFGHALEALAGYDGALLHGEAVAIGMAMAAEFAAGHGMLEPPVALGLRNDFKRFGLPRGLGDVCDGRKEADIVCRMATDQLAAALARDKKAADGKLRLVLPAAIGACRLYTGVPVDEVVDFMRAFCANAGNAGGRKLRASSRASENSYNSL